LHLRLQNVCPENQDLSIVQKYKSSYTFFINEVQVEKHNLLSDRPPVLSNSSGGAESPVRVAAVTLSFENCSCSQATYSRSTAISPELNESIESTACLNQPN
jgi:hypothetical protein